MKQTGDLLSIIEETLGGLRIIKAFRAESQLNRRFTSMNDG
jgi:ABC-type multidrug transport system fused ATPase/permease subunit